MAIARPILGLVSLLLIAGGIVMTFFIVLSGAQVGGSSISQIYFLQADTGGVSNPNDNYRNPARWTYLAICAVQNGNNNDCTSTRAAQPFNPVGNFGTSSGLPDRFGSENHFYYLSRFAWVFYIIALFFAVVTFFLGMLALCTRLGFGCCTHDVMHGPSRAVTPSATTTKALRWARTPTRLLLRRWPYWQE
ncbi:hypothetical protein KC345_g28 [Hortaea werneckii]|nr:hypothetical protein KC345_g28 [Hortaea werneckii]